MMRVAQYKGLNVLMSNLSTWVRAKVQHLKKLISFVFCHLIIRTHLEPKEKTPNLHGLADPSWIGVSYLVSNFFCMPDSDKKTSRLKKGVS